MAQLVNFMAKTFLSMPTSKPYHLRNIMIYARVEKNVGKNTKPPIKTGGGGQTNKSGPSLTKSDVRGDASGKAEGDDAKTVIDQPSKIQ